MYVFGEVWLNAGRRANALAVWQPDCAAKTGEAATAATEMKAAQMNDGHLRTLFMGLKGSSPSLLKTRVVSPVDAKFFRRTDEKES